MTVSEDLALVDRGLAPDAVEARRAFVRLRRALHRSNDQAAEVERLRSMLARTPSILAATGLRPAAEAALDSLIAALGARRGMVGLVHRDGWDILVARDLDEADLDDAEAQLSRGVVEQALQGGEAVLVDDARQGDFAARESVQILGLRSVLCIPFDAPSGKGFLYVDNHRVRGLFDEGAADAVRAWMPLIAAGLTRAAEREAQDAGNPFPGFVTRNSELQQRLRELARVARFDASVLLLGETGTGKSLLAQQLHGASPRCTGPLIHLNCGALPDALIEAELFGARKGAFTGANTDRKGKFEAADGGTLFLDEINSMPESCQVKLLVALQERQVTPLGSNDAIDVDVRVIAAMNDLQAGAGLREDLYFRLAVYPLTVPPLRERPEDIAPLAQGILTKVARRYGLPALRLAPEALDELLAYSWPGNVRELENALDRAVLLAEDGVIERLAVGDGPPRRAPAPPPARHVAAPASQGSQGSHATPAAPRPSRAGKRIPREEFLSAWEEGKQHTSTVAQILGVRERSVYRLRKRYLE